ncbi:MAG: hypothetical protein QM788_08510 [Roseateles sp.]|uniref:hypothetical protein n=1 Tax=Roseateles sp. TaxID=1971397 RepID=UPI0039EA9A84
MNRQVLSVLLSAALLVGCATPTPPIAVSNLAASEAFRLTDLRPGKESVQEGFSYLVTNKAYGKFRIAPTDVQPAPMRLLQHRIFEALPADRRSAEVKVHHFVVYMNMEVMGKGVAAGAVGGLVGALLADAMQAKGQADSISASDRSAFDAATGEQEWMRAIYTSEENPNDRVCHIVYIETELDGKRVFSRHFAEVEAKQNVALVTVIDESIRKHVEQMMRN